jgi:hypothetical protein
MKTKKITFRITEEEHKAIEYYCVGSCISKTVFMRKLIQLFMLTYQD